MGGNLNPDTNGKNLEQQRISKKKKNPTKKLDISLQGYTKAIINVS